MPRAKVHPDARRRVVQACHQCKSSKRKCDASRPCAHCRRRGLSDVCDGSGVTPSREESRSRRERDGRRLPRPAGGERSSADTWTTNCNTSAPVVSNGLDHHVRGGLASHEHLQASSPDTTRANMLSNNAGEYVFVGRSASLSFLQLMRETVARCIGPSGFSEHVSRDNMLEVDLDFHGDRHEVIVLDGLRIRHCVEHYFLATTGLMDVIAYDEAMKLLDAPSGDKSYLATIRLLVIAIGLQAGPMVEGDEETVERRAFTQAREMMLTSMLENPSLDMIQAFLLISFYMLGACRRNAAFIYLGIASRAAHALGLQTIESYAVLDNHKRYAQLRCWKSLVTLDLMVTSILGRSTSILAQRSSNDTIVKIADRIGNEASAELEAVYRLALVTDSISSQFNGPEPVTIEIAQAHLTSLKNWSDMLPAKLRPSTIPENDSNQTRQSLLGCMHVSCFYYFTVMLVTRPFLIMHITQRLFRKKDNVNQVSINSRESIEDLSLACLNAATYMAQTCSDLLGFNLLVENMCLLKAWIFAAGLVLGFEMLANKTSEKGTDEAFTSCLKILQKLGGRSPQAAQYHEILVLLSSAIERYRSVKRSRNPQNSGGLVTRIMNSNTGDARQTLSVQAYLRGDVLVGTPSNVLDASLTDLDSSDITQSFQHGLTDLVPGMDDFATLSPDSFIFDLQSFGMMPWGPL